MIGVEQNRGFVEVFLDHEEQPWELPVDYPVEVFLPAGDNYTMFSKNTLDEIFGLLSKFTEEPPSDVIYADGLTRKEVIL